MEPFGVYVHIPFCASRCPYCDFNSSVWRRPPWERFELALERELAARAPLFSGLVARSVYLGGGTPSLAPARLVERTLRAVRGRVAVADGAEMTVEVNPGTIDAAGLHELKAAGLDRVSIGWQSTHDRLLRVLGRAHTAEDSRACAAAARRAGFANMSVDLIFAVPGQTLADLDADLDAIEALAPEHVSLYALTYHEGTRLYELRQRGEVTPAAEELEADMMERIDERLLRAGYEHYEVSNYARPGFRAVHNTLYWTGVRYLGIGPGAHSFTHEQWRRGWRWESRRDVSAYLRAWPDVIEAGAAEPRRRDLPREGDPTVEWIERLGERELLSERMLCGLRLTDGVALDEPLVARHLEKVRRAAAEAVARGWAVESSGRLTPTPLGMRYGDALAELFF